MEDKLSAILATKSDEELEIYLIDIKRYTSTAINLALAELQKRGKEFTSLQLEYIESVVKAKVQEEKLSGSTKSKYKRYIVTDPAAPALYTQSAILLFSILFSVFFGAIMMSFNIKDKIGKWIVIGFGILTTSLWIIMAEYINISSIYVLGINAAGGAVLNDVFWPKYVGKTIPHRAKPIWVPLIIALVITIPLVIISIYAR